MPIIKFNSFRFASCLHDKLMHKTRIRDKLEDRLLIRIRSKRLSLRQFLGAHRLFRPACCNLSGWLLLLLYKKSLRRIRLWVLLDHLSRAFLTKLLLFWGKLNLIVNFREVPNLLRNELGHGITDAFISYFDFSFCPLSLTVSLMFLLHPPPFIEHLCEVTHRLLIVPVDYLIPYLVYDFLLHCIRIFLYKRVLANHLHENNHHSKLFTLEICLQEGYMVALDLAIVTDASLNHSYLLFEAKKSVVQALLVIILWEETYQEFFRLIFNS